MNYNEYALDISDEERQEAEKHRAFDASPEVLELRDQLNNGLITAVEFSHAILDSWSRFQP